MVLGEIFGPVSVVVEKNKALPELEDEYHQHIINLSTLCCR
jgi:hypothetical protein